MLTWEIVRHRTHTYHRATIGVGLPVALYAFIQDNGEGFFNWCISPDAGDYMMEHPRRIPGGSLSLEQARADVQREAVQVVDAMAKSLTSGPMLPEGLKLTDLAEALDAQAIVVRFPGGKKEEGNPLLRAFFLDEDYAKLLIAALQKAVEDLYTKRLK